MFFLEVVADGEGRQGDSRELDSHALDELEGVLGRETPRRQASGEEAQMDRGEGNRWKGGETEILDTALVDPPSFSIRFDPLVVAPNGPVFQVTLVDSGKGHR